MDSTDSREHERPRPAIAIGPFHESEGGVRTHVLGIMRHSAYPMEPIRYSPLSPSWPGYRGVGYTVFSGRLGSLPDPYASLVVEFRLRRYRLIHTHGHPYWLSLYKSMDRARIPRLHTVHQIYRPDEARTDREKVMRHNQNRALGDICRTAQQVLTLSRRLHEEVLDSFGVDSLVIPNGVDVEACDHGNGDRFCAATSIRRGFVLYVGSKLGVKRPELMCRIAEALPDRTFVAIGSGLDLQGLERIAGSVPSNVIPLAARPQSFVLDAMDACSAVLLTSRREAFSTVALEGFACGRPVLVPRGSGMEEFVVPVQGDLVYDADDVAGAAERIRRVSEDHDLGRRGREYVAVSFGWARVAAQIDRVYAAALESIEANGPR